MNKLDQRYYQENLNLPPGSLDRDSLDAAAAVLDNEADSILRASLCDALTQGMVKRARRHSQRIRAVATFLRSYAVEGQ